jgi:hypothetical protein
MDFTVGEATSKPLERGTGHLTPRRLVVAGYAIAGTVAGACYSSFVAARPLGSRLSMTDSYVSELEVPGQPASAFFRLTDLAGALLIIVIAVALLVQLWPEVRAAAGCLFLAGVGLASVADALDPMPCTPSTSLPCRQSLDQVPIIAQLHQGHTLSSVVGVCAAVLAMLLLGVSRRVRRWRPRLAGASLVCGVLLLTLGLSEVRMTASDGVGSVERLHVLLISAWIIALSWHPLRSAARSDPNPAETPGPGDRPTQR